MGQPAGTFSTTVQGVLTSPWRNVARTAIFVGAVFLLSTLGFAAAGWDLGDAAYMVILTIFSVGYEEVHPINTPWLRALDISTIVLGCTGMIVMTGALVQLFTQHQMLSLLGVDRMQTQIERLSRHTIVCGLGRIGHQLAKELARAGSPFLIVERDAVKIAEAEAMGYLCLAADATDEDALKAAGIDRARVLATVLPDDAANVFITLSARNLNSSLEIIARGETPSTEGKLIHAGADKVVLPTHIGAERIAEMILYPSTEQFVEGSEKVRDMKRGLHDYGLELEAVVIPPDGVMAGATVAEAERAGDGTYFIVQLDRLNGPSLRHPTGDVRIAADDTVVLVIRSTDVAAGAILAARKKGVRQRKALHGARN